MKMFVDQIPKLAKGFIRLGHDVRVFSYSSSLCEASPLKSKTFSGYFYKPSVDKLLSKQIKSYQPEIIYINFPKNLNAETIGYIRKAAPNAVLIGDDGDPWPKLVKGRIQTAKELDIVTATNDGSFLQDYRDSGARLCVFIPNL
jgi:hypothetical protein